MEDGTFYVTLPSNSSKTYYPDNDVSRFKTHLAQTLSIPSEKKYKIGLAELILPFFPSKAGDCYIYSSAAQPSILGDTYSKLLRVVRVDPKRDTYEFQRVYFHDLEAREINTIDILLADQDGNKFFTAQTAQNLATIIVLCFTDNPTE